MNITKAAIEKNRITIVSLVLIFLAGIGAYNSMSRSEDPGFTVRTALIQTFFPGASPARVEQLVTDKLEQTIQEIPQVDNIVSESRTGISIIFVNIKESEKVMRPIWDDLRRKVDRARSNLPEEAIGPFVNDEFGDVFGIIIAITGDGFSYAEMKEVADECRNELLSVPDVAKVDIYGAQDERVFVEYNNARLAELGLSPFALKQILEGQNIITPGGTIYTADEQIVLEPTGNFESIDDLRHALIRIPGQTDLVYLGDIARVTRGYVDPPKSMMRYRGKPSLGLAVNMREGGNIVTLGENIKSQLAVFKHAYPIGVDFDLVAFQPFYVDQKVNDFVINLLEAMGIVLAVMLLTLGFRTGLVVSSLIPMAMVMALLVMSMLNIGLDQMSLASLIIALGMLVDNAIVMSESIMVQMQTGKDRIQAAIDSAKELRIPLLISSLTTAAAFLPIFLAESTTGEYTAPLFKVVTITLLCSWILSLTMTPYFCVKFLKVKVRETTESFDSGFYRRYRGLLVALVRRPLVTVLGVVLLFAAAMFGMGYVPNIFFPPNEKPIFFAELKMPIGTPLEKTAKVVDGVEQFVRDSLLVGSERTSGVIDWASFIGSGAPRYLLSYTPEPESPSYAYLMINATSRDILETDLIPRLERFCFQAYPDLVPTIRPLFLGPPVDAPIEVRVSGKVVDSLFALVDNVRQIIAETPGTRNIDDNWGMQTKKLLVHVNEARARRAGLTNRDVALSLQTVLSGFTTTEYRENDEVIPVVLRSVAADREDIGKLESHNIFSQVTGRSVPLKQVADIEVVWEPSKILRRDRFKTVTLQAGIDPGQNAIALAQQLDAVLKPKSEDWGIGYKYELGGELESSGEANASIGAKLPIAGLLIAILLVGQFNSIRRALIIILTVPLGIIGVVIGLLATKSYFGFMTLLGVISLAGIVVNNAIVLLDRINIEMYENKLDPRQAVIEASQRRLRPILLTTATTVGGLLPLWFFGGIMFRPMAISIIFGLMFATMLTLGVVPVLFSIFFRVKFKDYTYSGS